VTLPTLQKKEFINLAEGNMTKKKWASVTKVVGILALAYSLKVEYDIGVYAGVALIALKHIKPALLAWKGIDDDEHK